MLDLSFPIVPTNARHHASLATLRTSLESWFQANFKADTGYYINGSEIYWISKVGPNDGTVDIALNPGLSVGLRQGNNEGWIVLISACLKMAKGGSAYLPIYQCKIWTPTAGADLAAAILKASWDAFQPEAGQ